MIEQLQRIAYRTQRRNSMDASDGAMIKVLNYHPLAITSYASGLPWTYYVGSIVALVYSIRKLTMLS